MSHELDIAKLKGDLAITQASADHFTQLYAEWQARAGKAEDERDRLLEILTNLRARLERAENIVTTAAKHGLDDIAILRKPFAEWRREV